MAGPDLLRTGIYTVTEAADLLGISPQKIRAWVDGWPGSSRPPVIRNELGWVDDKLAFSFANLMELRFIVFFQEAGVKTREIRKIIDEVRSMLNRPHPFATDLVFKTDGAKIVAEIARQNGVADLYDLRSKNFEMADVVYKSLRDDVLYDPKEGTAVSWFPRQRLAPNVIIHPKFAFGRPILNGTGIPTEAVADAVIAEGSAQAAAALFDISKEYAEEAAVFEKHIRAA